jgi:hypothetical protein
MKMTIQQIRWHTVLYSAEREKMFVTICITFCRYTALQIYNTNAPAIIPTTIAKDAINPAFEVQGNTVFPALLLPAAVALATTELNDAAILDAPLPLNVANCSDTLDETIDALALAILATELIDKDMDDMDDRADGPPPAEAKDDSPPPTAPPPPALPSTSPPLGAGVEACEEAKTIRTKTEMSRRMYMVFGLFGWIDGIEWTFVIYYLSR